MALEKRSSYRIVKSVIFALILREMRGRFSAKRFGAFWVFFEPAVQIALYMMIFSFRNITVRSGIDFPLFLMSGMIPFFVMRNIVFQSMAAVDANRALFAYKQIQPLDTLVARAIIETIIYAVVFALFMFILGFILRYEVSFVNPLRWLSVLSIGLLFSFALGMIFCMLVDALPEAKTFVRIVFWPIYILSGVLYPIWVLPSDVMNWLLWNPYVHIIDELRRSMFLHYPEHTGVNLLYPFKVAVIMLLVAFGLYRIRRLRLVAI